VVPQLGGFMAQTSGEVLSEERGWLMQRIELDEAKTFLRRTPQVLDALLRGLPEAWVHENEGCRTPGRASMWWGTSSRRKRPTGSPAFGT
jgi:hypothetical protein